MRRVISKRAGGVFSMRARVLQIARELRSDRYPDAAFVVAAGSFLRGDWTVYSDLDLVVVFESLPHAYRESFTFDNTPVEVFAHDPETLRYFISDVDRPSGVPSLAKMLVEGHVILDESELYEGLKTYAESVIAAGPPPLAPDARARMRYGISDTIDDLRAPRSPEEMIATGTMLYRSLADYHLRSNGYWSGSGKYIPRALHRADPQLARRYHAAFSELFSRGDTGAVIRLSLEMLAQDGGYYFDGYRADAPPEWRRGL